MTEQLKARLNLKAVMRNLEALPELDAETAALIRDWNVSVRFSIRGDVNVMLQFHEGRCSFHAGSLEPSDVHLFFLSPAHLNAMFSGNSSPIPLKGFSRLGFLKKDFSRLTGRLEYFLKPTDSLLLDEQYVRVNTALSLYTAVSAVDDMVHLDPVARQVGLQMPRGVMQFSVMPEGPHAHIIYDGKGNAVSFRGQAMNPSAIISFGSLKIANALFNGKLDGFGAIALGDVRLKGVVPMIENTNLILDRVPLYLQ